MSLVKLGNQIRGHKRRIAAENHHGSLLILQEMLRLANSMACAQLLCLHHELSLVTHSFLYLLTAKAHNHNIALGTCPLGSIQHMLQHRLASRLVQNLRQL